MDERRTQNRGMGVQTRSFGGLRSEAVVEEACKLGHVFSVSASLTIACFVDWATRSHHELQARADAAIAASDEHGFSFNRAMGTVFRGWALTGSGQAAEGIAQLRAGLAAFRATGAMIYVPVILTLLADAEGKAKQRDEGLGHLAEAERLVAETEERWAEADLHRVRGELLQAGHDLAAAERCFCQAIGIAALRNSRVRSSGSCAPRSASPGSGASGASAMPPAISSRPICGWFTEGFDTPVLTEAKALLDTLAQ